MNFNSIKILCKTRYLYHIDEHKEINRLNVLGVDDLSVTWNVLKR